jgi:hypothetical protein
MTRRPTSPRIGNDIFWLWFACAVALGAGWYLTFGLLGTAIETQQQRTGRISGLRLVQAQTLAQRPALEREGHTIEDRLRQLDLRADKPTVAARFIRTATRVAAAHQVNLDGVEERGTVAAADPATGPPGNPFSFEPIPFDVTLSGSYRGLLATIGDLAQTPVSMQIAIAAIERNGPPAGDAANVALTARLHIVLQRLPTDAPAAAAPLPQNGPTHARPL